MKQYDSVVFCYALWRTKDYDKFAVVFIRQVLRSIKEIGFPGRVHQLGSDDFYDQELYAAGYSSLRHRLSPALARSVDVFKDLIRRCMQPKVLRGGSTYIRSSYCYSK
jgi:hypothetical protein